MTDHRLTRRRLMTIAGAAPIGIALSASTGAAATAGSSSASVADAVIAAFRKHRIVAIGEVHGQQEHSDAMQTLLLDPRLPDVVDDIVVEFGNALYQPTVDRFVAGRTVEDRDLRLVWRNTTQSPGNTWDSPMYEQFYRTVRAANGALPERKRMRVLLGDPPIDWPRAITRDDVMAYGDRNGPLVSVVQREVIDKGRRALIYYGTNHVKHFGETITQIEQMTGERAYVILDGGHPRLASHPRRVVIPAKGTWLESAPSTEFDYLPGECGVPFGWLADALLYLGPIGEQTESVPNPAIYLDPDYWRELQRRNALRENPVDLAAYRREHSVVWQASQGDDC